MKAGKAASGEFSAEKSVKSGKAMLVIVPEDASDNTKKMFSNMCAFYKVPNLIFGTKQTLGDAIGKGHRSSLAINDEGFAKAILKMLRPENENGCN